LSSQSHITDLVNSFCESRYRFLVLVGRPSVCGIRILLNVGLSLRSIDIQ